MSHIKFIQPDLKKHGVLCARLNGTIDAIDMSAFYSEIDALHPDFEKISVVIDFERFEGETIDSIVEKLKESRQHLSQIQRIAYVGDQLWLKRWVAFVGKLSRFFGPFEVKHFANNEYYLAEKWATDGKNPYPAEDI